MRRAWSGFFLSLLACSGADPAPTASGTSATPITPTTVQIAKADVERDLGLELSRATTEAMDDERNPRIEVWLVNRSATRSYPVVLANDGSEVGWREPHAYFAVELQRPSGVWEKAPAAGGARCGLYAQDWGKDVVTLAPRERVKMIWMPSSSVPIGDATKVRISALYAYGAHARDKAKVPPVLHTMPEYKLASAPMELPVEHPYGLELRVKGELPAKADTPVASAIDVTVVNRSQRPLPFGVFTMGAQLWLETKDGSDATELIQLKTDAEPTRESLEMLPAGARSALVNATTRTDDVPLAPRRRILKVRAVWRVMDRDTPSSVNMRRVESPWVDVQPR